MVKAICTDLKKVFQDFHIYLCMMVLGIIFVLAHGEVIRTQEYSTNFTSVHAMLSGNSIMLCCFLICIVGSVFLYCTEEKHGYLCYEIQRIGVKIYTISKIVTSVISGFVTAITGFAVNTIAIVLFTYMKYRDETRLWPSADALEEYIWEIILFAMLCGLLSAIGFVVATFYENFYVAMTAPILIYYALLSLYNWIPVPLSLQISKVFLSVGYVEYSYMSQFIFALLYTTCHMVVFYKIAKRQIQRRIEHA